MSVTILDLLGGLPNIATEHRADLVRNENGYITIVKGVPPTLSPHTDFEINGSILISDTFNNVIRRYGSTTLEELCDFNKENIKLCWSNEAITEVSIESSFKLNLVLRMLSFDVATQTVNFVALRNKYGSSTITLTHQFEK